MSKLTEFYSQLAASTGMRYDGGNNVIYGQKDGYDMVVYAADSQAPYALTIHTAAKTPTGAAFTKEEFKALSKSVDSLGVGRQEGNHVLVNVVGSINQKKLRDSLNSRLPEAMNGLVSFLRSRGCTPCCSICGQPEEVAPYVSGSGYLHLCQGCEANMRGNLALAEQKQAQKKENVVGGIVGALLGSLVGVLCIILLSQLGYVAALSGAVMAVGVLKGYELLGGRLTKKGIIISAVIMLAMTYVGDRIDTAILLWRDGGGADAGYSVFECYRLVPWAISQEVIDMTAYIGNLALLYIFLLLGAVPTVINKVKEKKNEGRMARIGSTGGFGSCSN